MRIFYALSIILLMLSTPARSQEKTPSPPPSEPVARMIKFYPNPATSFITFDFQRDYRQNLTFQIYNLLGKKVYDISNISPRTIVNLSDFFRGVYIFQLKDKSGKLVDSGKFQVSK